MITEFDYWGLLAGIALFLFAMAQLESGLKSLGGRSLANYLKRHTGRSINAVVGGTISTALLQSSSMVGLMVLAFTGAGLLSLTSALGIIFGSNLGTTLTGWIVATLGFKFEVFEFSLPLIGLGGLTYLFGRGRWSDYGRTALSLGLLLLGLQFMKSSVGSLEQLIDINELADLAPWQYLLFGTVVAAVIQSSSATMIITLAALNAGIIALPNAAAVAIGADLGTTTTVLIGAIGGSHTKKQVAAGHVLFNVITDVLAFVLRVPLLALVAFIGIEDPLFSLVAFHSLFNLIGILIFVPFTDPFARRLELWFPRSDQQEARYLSEVRSGVSEAAVNAIERETSLLIARVVRLTMTAFNPPLPGPAGHLPVPHQRGIETQSERPFDELYRATKILEGELVEFTIRLQADSLNADDSARLRQLLGAAREAMQSAKAMKDIRHNLIDFTSSDDAAGRYAERFRASMQAFLTDIYSLRQREEETVPFEDLANAMQGAWKRHDTLHEEIYADVRQDNVSEMQVSSLLNVNRELLTSNRTLLIALGDYYLEKERAEDLERMPV
ncbi:MAG: Na/Pi cotransporter family protein [Gammaproteobacteria bacterium]